MFNGFRPELFKFFEELCDNNNRPWFAENKSRYEDVVLFPAMNFVEAMQKPLRKITPHFTAIPKRVSGSIMRIYRDTRFSKDKTPYKTNLAVHFRHESGKSAHAPGFYFHVDTKNVFMGAGVWRPESTALSRIRALIDDDPARWKRIKNRKAFRESFDVRGDSLKRPPKGYEASHPLIDELKRKDHFVQSSLKRSDLYGDRLVDVLADKIKLSLPYMRFLCDSMHLPC